MKLPLAEFAALVRARADGTGRLPSEAALSTDSRTLAPGDLYVALRGERFDGHAFVAQALERGACGAVVVDPGVLPADAAGLVVDDTLAAYQTGGALARRLLRARVLAITGSAGKTTTKAFAAQLLAAAGLGPVAATPANENNEYGVPKLFLATRGDERTVVVEMGARHFGDIEPLSAMALPDVALVTNIGEAHLEIAGSRERLAETKFGIFAHGGLPLLNLDDAESRARSATMEREPAWFGAWNESGAQAVPPDRAVPPGARALVLEGRRRFVVHETGATREFAVDCRVPGEHNLPNVAAALAAAWMLGANLTTLAAAVSSLRLPEGRYERRRAAGFVLIYDAYNASTSGMLATLRSFAAETAPRKLAVLGSMAELGPDAPQMHERVGAAAAGAGLGVLLVGGDFAAELARGAREAGMPDDAIVRFANNAAALAWLRANARADDLILLKASRRYHLEEILEGLQAAHA